MTAPRTVLEIYVVILTNPQPRKCYEGQFGGVAGHSDTLRRWHQDGQAQLPPRGLKMQTNRL
jgi:hypothetical protein